MFAESAGAAANGADKTPKTDRVSTAASDRREA
jgi:hypothetical protein